MQRLIWIVLLACLALAGCKKEEPASASPVSSEPPPLQQPAAWNPSPLATQLCSTLHTLAATRRQECCGGTAPRDLSAMCTQELDAALVRRSVRVDASALGDCTQSTSAQLQGCDWVGALPPVPSASCRTLVQGTLSAGAPCASSLECNDGLYCQGAGPGVGGVCSAPAEVGSRCETPSDNLAVAVHGQNDPRHPSCNGACVRGQCLARAPEGAECSSTAFCQSGLNCIEGRCSTATLAVAGAACSGNAPCAEGLICNNGLCATPAGSGERCRLPFECRSMACIKAAEDDQWGQCADVCTAPMSTTALPKYESARLLVRAAP